MTDLQLDNLPILDWQQCLILAGNKEDLAEDILQYLISNLPQDLLAIQTALAKQNYSELQKQVHKLHGAVCYCGLPRIKTLLHTLETELKSDKTSLVANRVNQLAIEVQNVLRAKNNPRV